MQPLAFSNSGRFYKGNLHTHSTGSDGLLAAAEVCRRYKARGYDFLALTDHFVGACDYPITDTRDFRDDKFTTLIGAELHSGAMDNGELWHILAVGLPFDFGPSNTPQFRPIDDQETGAEIAARAVAAGAFVAIAHPEWSGLSEADMRSIFAAHAVEIYNHGCEVECDRASGLHHADFLARNGRKLSFVATDDAHFTHEEQDAFGGWTMVKAAENTPEALLAALKDGASYASTGPDFVDIEMTENEISIRCSAVSAITLQGAGVRTEAEFGQGLESATLSLAKFDGSPWIRVTLIDAQGKKAWSNPIWR
ncbi:MAG: CehA/McbA family metallohydrolase [Alphaproteobacteria bacterium]|nr:CehA/McbA family metallohydrolase [Alphaproteobacteria bacterium]